MKAMVLHHRTLIAHVVSVVILLVLWAGCGDDSPSGPANEPPTVLITAPHEGTVFSEADTVDFEGSATDPEEGPLAGAALVWSSSIDGPIGTGETARTADLSAGAHVITLTATDSRGATGTATVAIEVTPGPVIIELQWVSLPGGQFMMGSPPTEPGRDADEGPQHTVDLPPFAITTTEVTTTHYARWLNDELAAGSIEVADTLVVGSASGRFPGEPYLQLGLSRIRFCEGSFCAEPGFENAPVIRVTWYGAEAFCQTFGWRLPTEAEWEYACRAGTGTALYNGEPEATGCELDATLDEIAWYCGNAAGTVHDVRQKTANAFGLFDMSGGAAEWCNDWYGAGYYSVSPLDDPPGPESGLFKVVRGGAWETHVRFCRSASRHFVGPDYLRSTTYGFRPARD